MKHVMVVGRSLKSEKFETIFEMLDDGVDAGKLTYTTEGVDTWKARPDDNVDGYIYIVTSAKIKDKPFISIAANDDEESMILKIRDLGNQLNKRVILDPKLSGDAKTLAGIIMEIDGKEIHLDREGMESLKSIMTLCKEYQFKIKEVISE